MSDLYAVIGNPIEHSKSPGIHAAFARQTGQDIRYERLLGDLEEFEDDVETFFADGGRGLNETVPFKERAFRLADTLSERAHDAGAVNTLALRDDGLFVLQGDEARLAEIARLQQEQRAVAAKLRALTAMPVILEKGRGE